MREKLRNIDINKTTAMNRGLYPRDMNELAFVQVGPGNINEALAISAASKKGENPISPVRASQIQKEMVVAEERGLTPEEARTTLTVEDAVTRALDNLFEVKGVKVVDAPDVSEVRREPTIYRAVRRNGHREAGITISRSLGYSGDNLVVQEIHVHSAGKDVVGAVKTSDGSNLLQRDGDLTKVNVRLDAMLSQEEGMQAISPADLKRSRGVAEREARRLLAIH
jgi:hypothetical protein